MGFKIGDNIVYAGSGVCQIDDIKDISFFKEKPQKYYVLKPLFVTRSQYVYVPYDNEAQVSRIRPVASKKEAIALIDKLPIDNCSWIEDRNERKSTFTDIIVNGPQSPPATAPRGTPTTHYVRVGRHRCFDVASNISLTRVSRR